MFSRLQLVVPRRFSLVCFRLKALPGGKSTQEHAGEGEEREAALRRVNEEILETVNSSGEAFLTHTVRPGGPGPRKKPDFFYLVCGPCTLQALTMACGLQPHFRSSLSSRAAGPVWDVCNLHDPHASRGGYSVVLRAVLTSLCAHAFSATPMLSLVLLHVCLGSIPSAWSQGALLYPLLCSLLCSFPPFCAHFDHWCSRSCLGGMSSAWPSGARRRRWSMWTRPGRAYRRQQPRLCRASFKKAKLSVLQMLLSSYVQSVLLETVTGTLRSLVQFG